MKKKKLILGLIGGSLLLPIFLIIIILVVIACVVAGESSLGTAGTGGSGVQTVALEGSIFYSDYYKSVVKSHLKSKITDTDLNGYVPLIRTQLVYEVLMDEYISTELNLTEAGITLRSGYTKPEGMESSTTCYNVTCSAKQLAYSYAIYNGVMEARSLFNKAYELNLTEDGLLKPIDDVCDELNTENNLCSEEWLNSYVGSGLDSFDYPYTFLQFPFNSESSWTLSSLFNVWRNIVTETATSVDVHHGWDIAAEENTPIYSSCSGTVIAVSNASSVNEGGGTANYIKVLCDDKIITDNEEKEVEVWYWHLYPNSMTVDVNDHVDKGQWIAGVGTTGNSTGNHLHLEMVFHDSISTKLDAFYYINWSAYLNNIDADVEVNTKDEKDFYDKDSSTYDVSPSICYLSDGTEGRKNIIGECVEINDRYINGDQSITDPSLENNEENVQQNNENNSDISTEGDKSSSDNLEKSTPKNNNSSTSTKNKNSSESPENNQNNNTKTEEETNKNNKNSSSDSSKNNQNNNEKNQEKSSVSTQNNDKNNENSNVKNATKLNIPTIILIIILLIFIIFLAIKCRKI